MTGYDWRCSGCKQTNSAVFLRCECGKQRWQQLKLSETQAITLQELILPEYVISRMRIRGIIGIQ